MSNRSTKQPTKVRGCIERIFYAAPTFSAGTLRTDDGKTITFSGNLYAEVSQPVILVGSWTKHPKYGDQFKVDCMEHDLAISHEGLINYLANHPDIKGIGPAKARLIVEALGDTFEEVLLAQPHRIAEIAHVSDENILRLQQEWQRKRNVNSVLTYLSAFGLTHHQTSTLVDKYGVNCIPVLKANPYIIAKDVKGFGFKKVDKIARQLGTPKEHPGRISAAIEYCLEESLEHGHCWIERTDLINASNDMLFLDCLNSRMLISNSLSALIDEGTLVCQKFGVHQIIALPFIQSMEQFIAEQLFKADERSPHFSENTDIEKTIENEPIQLNQRQHEAVSLGLRKKISLITGMAGTGKSRCMAVLNTICNKFRLKVALAAPTGKAAKRMEELTDQNALTIHRLLEYGRDGFARNEYNPIDAHVVMIDEVGMIDIALAFQLFKAIDFSKTTVVFFGDPNQLPPVGPGNVLRDLVQTKAIPTVTLESVVRQAGVLKSNCTAILKGEIKPTSDFSAEKYRDWYMIDKCCTALDTQHFVLDAFRSDQFETMGFDCIRDVQLLTPTHKGPIGTQELNGHLQRIIQKKLYDVDVPVDDGRYRPQLFAFDKVIQTRNNYDLGVMNGSIGQVSEVRPNGTIVISFDNNNWIELKKGSEDLRDIQLAYCLTTHRTQGSEFPCVLVIVHSAHTFMLHRNLLYTGVTRAQKSVVVIGDRKGIEYSARHCMVNHRRTFLPLILRNSNGSDKDVGA